MMYEGFIINYSHAEYGSAHPLLLFFIWPLVFRALLPEFPIIVCAVWFLTSIRSRYDVDEVVSLNESACPVCTMGPCQFLLEDFVLVYSYVSFFFFSSTFWFVSSVLPFWRFVLRVHITNCYIYFVFIC